MEITVSQEQGRVPVTVLHVQGNIDSTTYQEFETLALQSVKDGSRNLLIDLHQVPYISSAGLRALNKIYNAVREQSENAETVSKGVTAGTYRSPHLKLLAPGDRVLETLKMSGFDMFLDIYPTLKQAVAAFEREQHFECQPSAERRGVTQFTQRRRAFHGSLEQLAHVRDFVAVAVHECDGSADDAFAMELACDEAAANIFNHAFENKHGTIDLTVKCDTAALVVRMDYQGRAFDPSVIPVPDLKAPLAERRVGGLGMYFMRQLMDEVTFQFDAVRGNQLTMRRILNLKERFGTMELTTEQPRPEVAIIHVVGSVDGSNFKELIARAQSLHDGGASKLVLDLAACEYMSSSGLVALNAIAKLLRGEAPNETENGWALLKTLDDARGVPDSQQLALAGLTPRVDRVLEMAGMKTYLPVYPDTATALAAL